MIKGTLAFCGLKSFKCTCTATQKCQGHGSLSEGSSNSFYCVSKQGRLWRASRQSLPFFAYLINTLFSCVGSNVACQAVLETGAYIYYSFPKILTAAHLKPCVNVYNVLEDYIASDKLFVLVEILQMQCHHNILQINNLNRAILCTVPKQKQWFQVDYFLTIYEGCP